MIALFELNNMEPVVCSWILVVTFFCGISHAFFSGGRPPSYFPCSPPRYDSCRETIEDLKALLEITHSLKPDTPVVCPTCTSTISEELIVKLVNALIYTATQNCGFNGKGCCGIPVNNGGGVGENTGVIGGGGNSGGLIGGGNSVIGGGGGIINGGSNNEGGVGGNTGVIGGGGNNGGLIGGGNVLIGGGGGIINGGNTGGGGGSTGPGGNTGSGGGSTGPGGNTGGGGSTTVPSGNTGGGGGNTGGTSTGGHKSDDGLINVGVLDGKDTAHVDLAGQKLIGVDLGKKSGSNYGSGDHVSAGGQDSKDPGLINLGILNKDNDLLNLGLGNTKVLGVDLGPSHDHDGAVTQGPVGGVTNGPLGGVTNAPVGGVTNGPLGGVANGNLAGNSPNNAGGPRNPVTGISPQSPIPTVNNADVSTNTATSQAAAVSPQETGNVGGLTNTVVDQGSSVQNNAGGSTAPGTVGGTPVNNVNSGNTQIDKDTLNIFNVQNKPTAIASN